MATSSSSCALPSSEPTSYFTCQTDSEMESSKACHWSELDESETDSEWSAETNFKYFNELKKDPEWGRFFIDSDTFEVGKKISHGAQADIYEARMKKSGVFDLVVKVMKGDNSLQAFQAQWPIGMLSARSRYKHLYDLPLITILGGTLLEDERLRGRFAFVMYRRWGDLRLLIDRRMKGKRSTRGPFSIDQVIHSMLRIAEQMDILHTKHDILHRDLKASNVLVWGKFEDGVTFDIDEKVELVVADFECSKLVMGTGFWKAPEIFQQLKDGVPSSKVEFTSKSDVYSYGMTSYEILWGSTPFHPEFDFCERDEVLSGRRPHLPSDIPLFLRSIIKRCWHPNPKERPNFSDICRLLKERGGHNTKLVVIDNNLHENATSIKVQQWSNLESFTLLQVIIKLVCMDLWILEASTSFLYNKIVYCLQVTNCEGKKVCDTNAIPNIEQVLSSLVKVKWTIDIQKEIFTQTSIVELSGFEGPLLLEVFSTILIKMGCIVDNAKCWTCNDRLECALSLKGKSKRILWATILEEFFSTSSSLPVGYRVALYDRSREYAYSYMKNIKPLKLRGFPSHLDETKVPLIYSQYVGYFEVEVKFQEPKDWCDVSGALVIVKVDYSISPSFEYGDKNGNIRRKLLEALQSLEKDLGEGKLELTLQGGHQKIFHHLRPILHGNGQKISSFEGLYRYTHEESQLVVSSSSSRFISIFQRYHLHLESI